MWVDDLGIIRQVVETETTDAGPLVRTFTVHDVADALPDFQTQVLFPTPVVDFGD